MASWVKSQVDFQVSVCLTSASYLKKVRCSSTGTEVEPFVESVMTHVTFWGVLGMHICGHL